MLRLRLSVKLTAHKKGKESGKATKSVKREEQTRKRETTETRESFHLHTNPTPPSSRERAWLFHCIHPRPRHRISFEHPCNIPASLDYPPLPPTHSTVSGGRVCWRLRRRGRKGDLTAATASPSICCGEACARDGDMWVSNPVESGNRESGRRGGGRGDVLVLHMSCRWILPFGWICRCADS